jgi:Calx-beta domain
MNRFDRCAYRRFAALFVAVVCATPPALLAQELVITTGTDLGGFPQWAPVVIFPDVSGAPADPPRNYVTALNPAPIQLSTHGLALVSANRALTTQISPPGINLIDTPTSTLIDNFKLPDPAPNVHYDGLGTLAVNPARTQVLALTDLSTLWVIPAPFDHTAPVTMVALPSGGGTAQTRGIAFDATTGRAYLALHTGIAVLDPPYTSIAFTIPSSNGTSLIGGIALSPDGATLVATRGLSSSAFASDVRIFHAPFSAASVPQVLTIPGASPDGLTFTPDGHKVLVVESNPQTPPMLPRVYAISAPYSSASSVDTLSFDTGGTHDGFEDIDISADGQLAALSGNSAGQNDPLILLKAPFTAGGFSFVKYDIPPIGAPYDQPGRGAGTARFWSTAILPTPDVQMWVDLSAQGSENAANQGGVRINEGNSGTSDALIPVNLSGPSTKTVTVHYATSEYAPLTSGAATAADNDYIPASGTLTFAPGETQKNIVVKVVGDTKYELDEGLIVTISNPVNATIVGSTPGFADTATLVILNDDAVIPFAILTTALPDGVTGVPYSFQLTGQGLAPLKWSAFDLPYPLTVDPVSGIISGIPINPGTVSVQISLTEGANYFTGSKFLNLTVTGPAIPYVTLNPNPLTFASRAVGSTSPALSTEIQNNSAVDLVLGNPIASIPPGSDFALSSGPAACTPGQTVKSTFGCNLYFTFTPQAAGTRTLNLPIASNAPASTLTLTGVGTGGGVPSIGAISRKVHGTAGTFDLPLSAVPTNPTTEPRIGPNHTIVVPFASTVTAATVTITEGVATAGTPTFSGNAVIVPLTGVKDQQYVTLTLTNVATSGGTVSGSVRVGFLMGDVNQNRVVTVSDLAQVNAQLAQFVTQANFLKDVNASGTLSVADKALTTFNLTRNLPAP